VTEDRATHDVVSRVGCSAESLVYVFSAFQTAPRSDAGDLFVRPT